MRAFFNSHQSERKGLFQFLLLMILGAAVVYFYPKVRWYADKEKMEVTIVNQYKSIDKPLQDEVEIADAEVTQYVPSGFILNPNHAEIEDFQLLGISAKKAQVIINYRNKGGRFYQIKDLEKIYSLTTKDIDQMRAYLVFDTPKNKDTYAKQNVPYSTASKPKAIIIDLNSADIESLQQLKGIGPVYANRIVKFRDALGGFYSVEQLKEVYHLPEEVVGNIASQIKIDVSKIKKININTASVGELKTHPYLRVYAEKIVEHRKNEGNFNKLEELHQFDLINVENYRKIASYLVL